jgi:hypothetical protein
MSLTPGYLKRKEGERMNNNKVFVNTTKCLLVLYPNEIQKLLFQDLELYEKAIKRGKSEMRYRAVERRCGKGQGDGK